MLFIVTFDTNVVVRLDKQFVRLKLFVIFISFKFMLRYLTIDLQYIMPRYYKTIKTFFFDMVIVETDYTQK